MPKIAVIQRPPVFLDKAATIEAAVSSLGEAAAGGARMVVFPEAFIPGYPAWIWRLRPGTDMGLFEEVYARLLGNAVSLDGDDLAPLREAARQHRVTIVCGMNEREAEFSRGTLYNTVVVIGPTGEVLNRHRKVMPTSPERMVWGFGDATGLRTVETPCGRVGTMLCWESYLPLARCALYAQGIDVYVAPTYDSGQRWIASMQHIGREGGCWVIGSGCAFQAHHISDAAPELAELYPEPDEWVNAGDSVVVAPGGKVVAGPLHEEFGILYADIDLSRPAIARRSFDAVGHYARPDLFSLQVNTAPSRPVEFRNDPDAED